MSVFNRVLNFSKMNNEDRKAVLSLCFWTHSRVQFRNTLDFREAFEEVIYVERCMNPDLRYEDVKVRLEFLSHKVILTGELSQISVEILNSSPAYVHYGMDNIVSVNASSFMSFLNKIGGFVNIALSDKDDVVRFFSHKRKNFYEYYTQELIPRVAQRITVKEYLALKN